MNVGVLLRTASQVTCVTARVMVNPLFRTTARNFSVLAMPKNLLKPESVIVGPISGLKHVASPKKRCKHCYVVIENETKYVFCDKFPRHKQVEKKPMYLLKAGRILTHATQGGKGHMQMWTQQGLREDY